MEDKIRKFLPFSLFIIHCPLFIDACRGATVDCGTAGCVVCATDAYISTTCTGNCGGMTGTCYYSCSLTAQSFEGDLASINCNNACRLSVSGGYVSTTCTGSCGGMTGSCYYSCPLTGQSFDGNLASTNCNNACRMLVSATGLQIKTNQTCATGMLYAAPKSCDLQICTTGTPGSDYRGSFKYVCSQ